MKQATKMVLGATAIVAVSAGVAGSNDLYYVEA